jgi:diacylglycerol O-acyltransferase
MGGLVRFATRPLHLVRKVVPETVQAVRDAYRRAAVGSAMAAPFSAPPTMFNSRFTANRNVAFTRLDLAEVKKVKNHFGVTVNDVLVTAMAGGMRRYLAEHDESLDEVVWMVPVNLKPFEDNLPAGWFDEGFKLSAEEKDQFNDEWTTKLFEGGWICATWPE